jgi:hypothetical protein
MREFSKKRRIRYEEVAPLRRAWIERAKCCMICGASPGRPHRNMPPDLSKLCCHEISNGPLRQKSLDKAFACLVLCCYCNMHVVTNKKVWPEARQLAVLLERAPEFYDLKAYLQMTRPAAMNRITQEEVDVWLRKAA